MGLSKRALPAEARPGRGLHCHGSRPCLKCCRPCLTRAAVPPAQFPSSALRDMSYVGAQTEAGARAAMLRAATKATADAMVVPPRLAAKARALSHFS